MLSLITPTYTPTIQHAVNFLAMSCYVCRPHIFALQTSPLGEQFQRSQVERCSVLPAPRMLVAWPSNGWLVPAWWCSLVLRMYLLMSSSWWSWCFYTEKRCQQVISSWLYQTSAKWWTTEFWCWICDVDKGNVETKVCVVHVCAQWCRACTPHGCETVWRHTLRAAEVGFHGIAKSAAAVFLLDVWWCMFYVCAMLHYWCETVTAATIPSLTPLMCCSCRMPVVAMLACRNPVLMSRWCEDLQTVLVADFCYDSAHLISCPLIYPSWFNYVPFLSFSPLLLHHVKLFIRSLIPQWCHLLHHCDMSFDAWYVGPISISEVPWSWSKPDVAVSSRCCCSATTWSRLSLKQKPFLEKKTYVSSKRNERFLDLKKTVSTVCFLVPVVL